MGYGFLGTFVDVKNKRTILTAQIDRLKALNLRRYACDLKDITPTGEAKDEDYPEITTDTYYEYVGYYSNKVFENVLFFAPYRNKDWNKTKTAYFLPEDVIEKNKELLSKYEVKPTLEEMKTFNEESDDIIILYAKKIKSNEGRWYKWGDFSKAEDKIKREYFEKRDALNDLRKLRNTKDYFEMSEDGKNSYLSEIEYLEESLEEYESEYQAIEYILNIFEFLTEDVAYVSTNNFDEKQYSWQYDDKREIELYIEVD